MNWARYILEVIINCYNSHPNCINFISSGFNYFEVEITELSADETSAIAIGVVPPIFTRTDFPGWKSYSIGYHGDDGGLHKDGEQGRSTLVILQRLVSVYLVIYVFSPVNAYDQERTASVHFL